MDITAAWLHKAYFVGITIDVEPDDWWTTLKSDETWQIVHMQWTGCKDLALPLLKMAFISTIRRGGDTEIGLTTARIPVARDRILAMGWNDRIDGVVGYTPWICVGLSEVLVKWAYELHVDMW